MYREGFDSEFVGLRGVSRRPVSASSMTQRTRRHRSAGQSVPRRRHAGRRRLMISTVASSAIGSTSTTTGALSIASSARGDASIRARGALTGLDAGLVGDAPRSPGSRGGRALPLLRQLQPVALRCRRPTTSGLPSPEKTTIALRQLFAAIAPILRVAREPLADPLRPETGQIQCAVE